MISRRAASSVLQPYVDEEKAKSDRRKKWLRPVETIFDLLSRGQYMAANLGEDVGRRMSGEGDVQLWKGLVEGATGKRKGDWRTTLFGGQDKGEEGEYEGWFKETPEWMRKDVKVPVIGPTSMEDVIGFTANVFLDPINYISFGSTTAAKAAAREVAERSVRRAVLDLGNLEELGKLAKKGFDKKALQVAMAKSVDAGEAYMKRYIQKADMSRFYNKVYKEAERTALRMTPLEAAQKLSPPGEAQDGLIKASAQSLAREGPTAASLNLGAGYVDAPKGMDALVSAYEDSLRAGSRTVADDAVKIGIPNQVGTQSYADALKSIGEYADTDPDLVRRLQGLGQRGMRLFGKEVLKSVRQPNVVSRGWQTVVDGLRKSKPGQLFDDAMWSMLNNPNSIVGGLKAKFGFRNPYETMLNAKKQTLRYNYKALADDTVALAQDALEGTDEETRRAIVRVLGQSMLDKVEVNDLLSVPGMMEKLGIDPKQIGAIKSAATNVKAYTDELFRLDKVPFDEGLYGPNAKFSAMANYLPTVAQNKNPFTGRGGTPLGSDPWYAKQKVIPLAETEAQEIAKFKWMGMDDDMATVAVMDKNWSSFDMDLEEMLIHRGLAHAQAMTNADMVRQFKEFGIDFGDAKDAVNTGLTREGARWDQLGLVTVDHPGMEGRFFDKDVAEIIDKVMSVTGSNDGLKWFGKFTAWWKGVATLSPGFHIRNDRTNRFALWVKNGSQSLDPKQYFNGVVGAQYALSGEEGLRKIGIPEETIKRSLDQSIAGKTRRQWADEARRYGVISKVTKGYDIQSTVKEYSSKADPWTKKLNPFKSENIAFEKSHEIGAVVESAPKFQSFMMDIENMAKDTPDGIATPAMIEYAQLEAKKWFFDYDDLTDFEKKIMKPIIPFYSWIRKNIALQVSNMVHYSEMYAMVPKVQRAIQGEDGPSMEDVPDWMRDQAFMPIARAEDMPMAGNEGDIRTFNPALPYTDLNSIPIRFEMSSYGIPIPQWTPEEIKNEFMQRANPLIKSAMGLMGSKEGWDPFTKRELDSKSPAPRALRLIARAPGVLQTLDALARVIRPADGLDYEYTDEGQLLIDGKIQFLLETNFIVLKRLEQMGDLPLTAFPELEKKLAKFTKVNDKYEGVERTLQTLSFWMGIKQKDVDQDKEEGYRFRQILKDAQDARAKELRRAPGAQARRTKYQRSQQTRERNLGLR